MPKAIITISLTGPNFEGLSPAKVRESLASVLMQIAHKVKEMPSDMTGFSLSDGDHKRPFVNVFIEED